MGSSKEIYDSLSTSSVFKSSDNLYFREILKTYAMTKSLNPMMFTKQLLDNIQLYLNPKALEKLGVTISGELIVKSFSEDDIKYKLASIRGVGPNKISLIKKYTIDEDNKPITGEALFISEFLNTMFNRKTDYSTTISETYRIQGEYKTFTYTVYSYDIKRNGTYYKFLSYSRNSDGSYKIHLVNENNSRNRITLTSPIDRRVYFVCAYKIVDDDDNNSSFNFLNNNDIIYRDLISSSDIRLTITRKNALVYVVKKSGRLVGQSNRYKKAIYHRFGLNKDFDDEVMSDSKVKDVFITFSTHFNNPKFKQLIDGLYGNKYDSIKVIYSGEIPIEYYWACKNCFNTISDSGSEYDTPEERWNALWEFYGMGDNDNDNDDNYWNYLEDYNDDHTEYAFDPDYDYDDNWNESDWDIIEEDEDDWWNDEGYYYDIDWSVDDWEDVDDDWDWDNDWNDNDHDWSDSDNDWGDNDIGL